MPWVIAAVEVALIATMVLLFVFCAPHWGFIPLVGLFVFDFAAGLKANSERDIIILPFGTIDYIYQLRERQSELEAKQQTLERKLPGAIGEATTFWRDHGTDLLKRVQGAANGVTFSPSGPTEKESLEQTADRLKADQQRAQAAKERQNALQNLAQQIQTVNSSLVSSKQ